MAAFALAVLGCSGSTSPLSCAVELPGNVCLDMNAAGTLVDHQDLIESEISAALQIIQPLIGATDVRISLIADPNAIIPEVGLGGFNPSSDEVRLFADPDHPSLEEVFREQLGPMLAHELHHAMRRRSVGYGSTLFEAAVTEGLADHFSLEVDPQYDPIWALSMDAAELAVWLPQVVAGSSGPYDHRAWFLGASPTIPRWTGYAVGYELVRAYLEANPTETASALVDTPASAFEP